MPPLLEVRGLRTGYGHVPVLHGVDLTVHSGETAVILGLNGAGKTTTMMTVAGLLRRWGGTVTYDDRTNVLIIRDVRGSGALSL